MRKHKGLFVLNTVFGWRSLPLKTPFAPFPSHLWLSSSPDYTTFLSSRPTELTRANMAETDRSRAFTKNVKRIVVKVPISLSLFYGFDFYGGLIWIWAKMWKTLKVCSFIFLKIETFLLPLITQSGFFVDRLGLQLLLGKMEDWLLAA